MTVELSQAQFAAHALTEQLEPLSRGFILIGLGSEPIVMMVSIDPGEEISTDLLSAGFGPVRSKRIILVASHHRSLMDAADDARVAREYLASFDIFTTVLISGDYLSNESGGDLKLLSGVVASLPAALGRPSPLRAWAISRATQFEAVAPAEEVGQLNDLEDRWVHTVVTGQMPDRELTARLAAAATLPAAYDRLMLAAGRLAFDEFDDASSSDAILSAIVGRAGRPQRERLISAGIAAQFVASHTDDAPAAAQLYALSGLMLWSEARGQSALRAVEVALIHDRSNGFARSLEKLLSVRRYPEWLANG